MLLARDYLVTPQHPVGNLRIDLVVRGGGHKLAIECDGDKFHGPDQWEDDLRRQTVLERLGWRFWRVRGSAFYRDPETATSSLWPLLDSWHHPGGDPEPPTPETAELVPVTLTPHLDGLDPDAQITAATFIPEHLTDFDLQPAPPPAEELPAAVQTSGRTSSSEEVRAWARENGRHIGARGRIAKAVIDDYNWEHPDAPYAPES